MTSASGSSYRFPIDYDYSKKEDCTMKEIMNEIDSAVMAVVEAAFWGVVKRIINKVRLILVVEGEKEGAEILDIIANK